MNSTESIDFGTINSYISRKEGETITAIHEIKACVAFYDENSGFLDGN